MIRLAVGILAIAFRYGIVYLAAALGLTDLADQYMSEIQQWCASAALFTVTLAYAIWKYIYNKKKQATAQATPYVTTEAALESKIKFGGAASITAPKDEVPDYG